MQIQEDHIGAVHTGQGEPQPAEIRRQEPDSGALFQEALQEADVGGIVLDVKDGPQGALCHGTNHQNAVTAASTTRSASRSVRVTCMAPHGARGRLLPGTGETV
jgi:hypothetical protein